LVDPAGITNGDIQQGVQQRFREQMWLQTEFHQFGMAGVVIVLFGFDARIGQMADFDVEVHFPAGGLHQVSQFQHRKLLRELIVDPAFSRARRVQTSQLDAADGVANIEVAARLPALAVNR
jgi:hypothetical protein